MKLYIGIPCYQNQIHSEVVQDILDIMLEVKDKGDSLSIQMPSSPFLSLNRNLIMQSGLNSDWILMWDSDIQVATPKFIYRMIDTAYRHNAVITGLLCRIKTYDLSHPEFACGLRVEGGYKRLTEAPKVPMEVDVMGAGVTLIKSSWVRDNLEQPYYEFKDGGGGERGATIIPEDWRFCEKVKERGGKIIVDPTISTQHYGNFGWLYEAGKM